MQTKLILTVACLITAFSLGDAQLASGAPSDAAAAAKRKVGIDTTFGDVVGRAQEAYRKKDYRRAVAGYTAALEMRPDKKNASELLLSRGNAYEWLGANQRALADYNEAIRLTPNDAEARGIRGDLLVTLDRPSDAVADLTEAIRKRPADIQAYSPAAARISISASAIARERTSNEWYARQRRPASVTKTAQMRMRA